MQKKLLFLFLLCCTTMFSYAQITNGQVNYELRVDQWRQTCDNDGLSNDDNEVRIGLTSDGNTGGSATWTSGGNGATCGGNNYVRRWQTDAPSTVTNTNTLLYYCLNRTNSSNLFTINHESWEEDGAPDCSSTGDACRSSGAWNVTFKSAAKTPNRFWAYNGTADAPSFVTGQSGDFSAKTAWRYTNGDVCGNALNFGTLTSGNTLTHTNSNRVNPTGSAATMGYTNVSANGAPDVFYQFTISVPSTVVISTNNPGTNFDTYLRLYNSTACGTQIAFDDDGGGLGTTSSITMDLCAGTYAIQVEGFSVNSGDFNLSVLATTRPATSGTIAGITNGATICPNTDPGAFTSSVDGTGAGSLSYQWESSTTSSGAGYGNIGGATSNTYDPGNLSQTTWFRRRVTDACGQVAYSNVIQVVINTLSTAPTSISGTTTICNGNSTTLTLVGGSAGTGATARWYSGSCGGTLVGSGNSVSVSPATNTTYFVRYEGTCNTTACASTTITVDATSTLGTVSTAGPVNFCDAGGNFTTAVNVSGQTGSIMWDWGSNNGVWNNNWVAGANSGICCFPKKTSNSDGNADRIRYRVTNGTCPAVTSAAVLIQNRYNEAPTSLASSNTVYCSNAAPANITLTASFPTNINMNGTVRFYSGSCGGTLVGSVSPSATSATAALVITAPASTTTYYVRYEPGAGTGCANTACVQTTVTVNTLSTAPTSISGTTTICNGTPTTLTLVGGSAGTGATARWYSGSCGGTLVGTGNSVSVSPAANTTYYVRYEGTCNTTTCASTVVTVNSLSTAPTSISGTTTICNGVSTTLTLVGGSAGTGATARWYSGSCGGTLVGSGNSVSVSPAANTTYYVRYEGTCNNTTCASTVVTVNTFSTAPTSISGITTICDGFSTTLTLVGGSAGSGAVTRWYSGSCGGTLVGIGNSVSVSPTTTTDYYVRYEGICNNTTCASTTVIVNTLSTAPTSISGITTICTGSSTTLTLVGGTAGTGATATWYSGSCGLTLVGTGNSISVSPGTTTTYYVRYEGTCNTTICAGVIVTVNTFSVAPTSISGTTTICTGGSTTLTLVGGSAGTGATARWYTGSCGGTLVGSGNSVFVSPVATTTYYVRYEGSCNNTTCASTTVTINTFSTAPTSISGITTICDGFSTTLTLVGGTAGTGATATWYSGSCGGTFVGSGNSVSVSPTSNTTYYVRYQGLCNTTTCASTIVTVNTPSTAPTIAIIGELCPNSFTTLSAAGGIAGTGSTINWYDAPNGGGTNLGTGTNITVSPMVTTTYYARREGLCNTTADDLEVAFVKNFVYATNNSVSSAYCTDLAGWHHFYNGSQIILSLQGDVSGLTSIDATIWDNNAYYSNGGNQTLCDVALTPGEQQFEMERSWNINYTGTLNGSYNVRYYYPMSERSDLEAAAANWMATYPNCGYSYKYNPGVNGWFWFKNTGASYAAPQYDGLVLSGAGTSSVNGINYSIISGITSFSGGSGGVILVPNASLPIDLISFDAKRKNLELVDLTWVTASETNNAGFEVERMLSTETEFTKIAFVNGHGTTTTTMYYNYTDKNAHLGTSYYRLRQVDFDGTPSYSSIKAVEGSKNSSEGELLVYPNPTSDALNVYFGYLPQDVHEASIQILDVLGRVVYSTNVQLTSFQVLEINELNRLPQASYLLSIQFNDGTIKTQPFVKQ